MIEIRVDETLKTLKECSFACQHQTGVQVNDGQHGTIKCVKLCDLIDNQNPGLNNFSLICNFEFQRNSDVHQVLSAIITTGNQHSMGRFYCDYCHCYLT